MKRRGFSLIEILVVIGILALLMGFVLPVVVQAKNGGKRVDSLSAMRQLGQAAAMYSEQTGAYPRRTRDLVEMNLVPVELCSSKQDPTPHGLANAMLWDAGRSEAEVRSKLAPYRDSFVGLGLYRMREEILRDYIFDSPGGGWLLDFSETQRSEVMNPMTWDGRYRRLQFDGAVVTRPFIKFRCELEGEMVPCARPEMLFTDPDERMRKWVESS